MRKPSAKNAQLLQDAIGRLAALLENGELMAASFPAEFMDMAVDRIHAADKALTAVRESHAREMMESATRYGEAIERLQRERDEALEEARRLGRLYDVHREAAKEVARDLQADRANVEVALEAMRGRVRELDGALSRARAHTLEEVGFDSLAERVGELETELANMRARATLAKGEP